MTRRLVLLRHGRTAWNVAERAQGHTDVELDPTGRAQATAVAPLIAAMAPTGLWSSDLARARQTADIVGEATGLTPILDDRLREYAVGDNRAGLTLAEYAERHPVEHADVLAGRIDRVPGREDSDDVARRMVPALAEIAETLDEDGVGVVVTHGAALRVGLVGLLGWPAEAELTLVGVANCGWVELERSTNSFTGGEPRWRLTAYNRTPDFASVPTPG